MIKLAFLSEKAMRRLDWMIERFVRKCYFAFAMLSRNLPVFSFFFSPLPWELGLHADTTAFRYLVVYDCYKNKHVALFFLINRTQIDIQRQRNDN